MKLTKRQLKRIIREEYSRLKRRGLIKESGYDYSKTYPAMDYEVVFTIIDEMYGNPPEVIADELASGIVDRAQLEEALDEAMESPMNSRSQKIIEMALDYMGTSRFSR